MSQALHVRGARRDETRALVEMGARAFKGRPLTEALFPKHLRTDQENCQDPVSREELEFRVKRQLSMFDHENRHFLVVADDQDNPIGCAIWQSHLYAKPEESESAKAKLLAARPKSMDIAVMAEIDEATLVLEKTLEDALGEEEYRNSWCESPSFPLQIKLFSNRPCQISSFSLWTLPTNDRALENCSCVGAKNAPTKSIRAFVSWRARRVPNCTELLASWKWAL